MDDRNDASARRGLLASIGPAIITASVVLGPGSILSSSRVGCDFGYSMIWVLAIAGLLMWGMTALSARLGVVLDGTICAELSQRAGRPIAILAGVSLFLVATCFQFGNNLGILAAVEPFLGDGAREPLWVAVVPIGAEALTLRFGWSTILIVAMNLLIIGALLGFRHLYKPVERLMKLLVAVMIVGFAGNLLMARPSISALAEGLIPSLPEAQGTDADWLEQLLPLLGMVATTFSVGGAFYQSYLVRQKGWTNDDARKGLIDSAVGIIVLIAITGMIMVTSAAVLHGQIAGSQLKSAADVAMQLQPLFGAKAKVLFCLGIFAGAFSSFLVNAMIGGTMLSDGLGLGGDMDRGWPKAFTVLALLFGMVVAIGMRAGGQSPVKLIIFAQALTVIAVPVLAGSMLWLATRSDLTGVRAVPGWLKALGGAGFLVVLALAARTILSVYDKLTAAG